MGLIALSVLGVRETYMYKFLLENTHWMYYRCFDFTNGKCN